MAFATQNVKKASMGNLKIVVGEWTGSEGDAGGTFAVGMARVHFAQFTIQDADAGEDSPVRYSVSLSGSTSTLTIQNRVTVTNGRFIVIGA